jgi:hypothetical protein
MASNQGWNEERTQTRKRGGGMHQLKEVDMLSAKLDLLMKKLDLSRCGYRSYFSNFGKCA